MFIRTQSNGSRTYLLIVENECLFCSFLALLLRRELEDRLTRKQWKLGWADIIRDLDNVIEMEVSVSGKSYVFRGQTPGVAGKVFQACGVALPPTLRASDTPLKPAEDDQTCH